MAKTTTNKKINVFKYLVLALCVLLVPMLAACDLVSINMDKQLNMVAASFDNGKVEVTREELIITYNSIGNSRFDNSSTPTQSGIEQTLELALNRSILTQFLTSDDFASERERLGYDKIELTTAQSNEIWRNVYSYLNDTISSYEDDLRSEDGVEITEPTEEETEGAYTPYEKTYEIVYDATTDSYKIQKVETEVEVENESIALFDTNADLTFSQKAEIAYNTFREKYWDYTDSVIMNPNAPDPNADSYSDEAWNDFISGLLRSEADRNLSRINTEAFLREVERIYNIYYQNEILTVFQNNYNETQTITNQMVVTKFRELYNAQYEEFNANPDAFDEAIPTTGESVYYMYDPTGYFKVNHFLVQFSDEQNNAIEAEEAKLNAGRITLDEYNKNVAKIKSQTQAYNRETGEYESMDTVYRNFQNAMSAAQSEAQKLVVFRDFMHKYTQDDATLNADSCYYIPLDEEKDTMEENFANASRELYETGKVCAYSGWVETSYGYHIIMYTGNAESISPLGSDETVILNLDAYRLNPLYNKTMLDAIIEQITLSSYSTYETTTINAIREGKEVVNYTSSYSDLY